MTTDEQDVAAVGGVGEPGHDPGLGGSPRDLRDEALGAEQFANPRRVIGVRSAELTA